MEKTRQKSTQEKGMLLLAAVLSLLNLMELMGQFTLMHLLWFAVTVCLTVLLWQDNNEKLCWYAFLAVGAVGLLAFLAGFSQGLYSAEGRISSSFFAVPGLLKLAGLLGVTLLGGAVWGHHFAGIEADLRKYWFLPALLLALSFLSAFPPCFFLFLRGYRSWAGAAEFLSLRTLCWAGFALLLGQRAAGYENASPTRSAPAGASSLYYSPAKLLILTILTLGIWRLVWVYRTTAALGRYEKTPRLPVLELLLTIFVPFYDFYWIYKSALLASVATDGQEDKPFGVLCLALQLFLSPVAMLIVQDKLNNAPADDEPNDWPPYEPPCEPEEEPRQAAEAEAVNAEEPKTEEVPAEEPKAEEAPAEESKEEAPAEEPKAKKAAAEEKVPTLTLDPPLDP